jgi:hypothetical protein
VRGEGKRGGEKGYGAQGDIRQERELVGVGQGQEGPGLAGRQVG